MSVVQFVSETELYHLLPSACMHYAPNVKVIASGEKSLETIFSREGAQSNNVDIMGKRCLEEGVFVGSRDYIRQGAWQVGRLVECRDFVV